MEENEWLTSIDSIRLVNRMRGGSDRKLRLVGCALSRKIWSQLSQLGQRSVEIAEMFADGLATKRTRITYEGRLLQAGGGDASNPISWLPSCAISECGWYSAELSVGSLDQGEEAQIVREIFGNPFRPVKLDPRWQSSTVLDLARTIYDERAFERLPILADALMDAGCDSETLINHCQGLGPHVRGCWVVDLLLGKE